MKNRLPSLLVALGLLGVSLYPRLASSASMPELLRTDFSTGLAMGVFLGVEMLGAMKMIRARQGRSSCRDTSNIRRD